MGLTQKVIIKEMNPLSGHDTLTLLTEEEIREKLAPNDSHPMIMVLPDGRVASTPDEVLEMIQSDIYRDLPEVEILRLPILEGG